MLSGAMYVQFMLYSAQIDVTCTVLLVPLFCGRPWVSLCSNGYGLTETSPVLTVRRPHHNVSAPPGVTMYSTVQ